MVTSNSIYFWGTSGIVDPVNSVFLRYDSDSNSLETLPMPPGFTRRSPLAVVANEDIIFFGGYSIVSVDVKYFNDGMIFNSKSKLWRPMSKVNSPQETFTSAATAWTGSEMLIWGGDSNASEAEDKPGMIYNPKTDSWRAMSKVNAPRTRYSPSSAWTGKYFVVWAGDHFTFPRLTEIGGLYDPKTDTWEQLKFPEKVVRETIEFAQDTGSNVFWTGKRLLFVDRKIEKLRENPTVRTVRVFAYEPNSRKWEKAQELEFNANFTNPDGPYYDEVRFESSYIKDRLIIAGGLMSAPASLSAYQYFVEMIIE